MLAKVHLAAKELGLDEETRRDVLERVTGGHRSAGDCSDAQLDQVLAEFKRQGWKPKVVKGGKAGDERPSNARRRAADSPMARKARAMWISLHQLGVVRDPSERALEAFGRRQLGVDRLQWADESQGYRLVEALKAMAERAGWSQDLADVPARLHVWTLKLRLVCALLKQLERPPISGGSIEQLDHQARALAAEIREAQDG
jgi:phage gp16-like protein